MPQSKHDPPLDDPVFEPLVKMAALELLAVSQAISRLGWSEERRAAVLRDKIQNLTHVHDNHIAYDVCVCAIMLATRPTHV